MNDPQPHKQKLQLQREQIRAKRELQQEKLRSQRELRQSQLQQKRESIRERNEAARQARRDQFQTNREQREQARELRQWTRASTHSSALTQTLKAEPKARMIAMSIAAQKYSVDLEQLRSWHNDGLLAHVRSIPGPHSYGEERRGDPLFEEAALALAVKDLRKLSRRQDMSRRAARALHLHRYRELQVEEMWSPELCQEVMISRQACSCGLQRQAVRQHLRLGWRTIAIEAVPRGTWALPSD